MNTQPLNDDIHQVVCGFITDRRPFALATVLQSAGSTPQKAGTKAIIDAAGAIWGTIGGGQVEGQAIRMAADAIRSGRPAILDFKFTGATTGDAHPICGGSMRVLIDPAASARGNAYAQAAAACRQRQRGVLVTSVRALDPPSIDVQWFPAGAAPAEGSFPSEADTRAALTAEAASHLAGVCPRTGASIETLVEPIVPAPQLLIVGGGHIAQALARHASLAGFEIVIVEDRPEFARPELFPQGAALHCGDVERILRDFPIDPDTYVAIVSRGHQHDAEALAECIRRPAAYVGMIGSRRKVGMIRQKFIESGLASDAEFGRVHAPIGLNIGAQTVPEIAISIVAELIAVRRKVASLHWTNGQGAHALRARPRAGG